MPRTKKMNRQSKKIKTKVQSHLPQKDVLSNIPATAPTSKAQLSSVIKSARDIMRKDAGLNGDLDRLPQLSWVLFLKSYDDLELRREQEAVLRGQTYKPVIAKGYRWRDWAADENKGRTGEDLIKFVNDDLFPKLRTLNGTDERQTIADVFKETFNRFLSGFLLRDVVNLIGKINFNSSDDIHTLSHLYESMLKEMRDAAGDSGEFYTPRPVVRFIVERVKPKLGDKILDPACGTGGFLVETYDLLEKEQRTVEDREILQSETLYGVEKKPMPFLLGMMNLLLHGVDRPNLRRDNALKNPLREITEKDRVNVIVTNPPFGGEEERGIQLNFPEATRTGETTLLFMQFIMRSLKEGGRCGMVVPNGTLFGDGVAARVKEQLLNEFNLHTIVRLPNGVFAPYADIPTNLLFFERSGPTKEIWYYELPSPHGRKNYTKTHSLQDSGFDECRTLWDKRGATAHSWVVQAKDVAANNFNLDIKNPNRADDFVHMPPEKLAADITTKEKRIAEIMTEIQQLEGQSGLADKWQMTPLRLLLTRVKEEFSLQDDSIYKEVTVRLWNKGVVLRNEKRGSEIKTNRFRVHAGQLILSRIDVRNGAIGIVPPELDGAIVSGEFWIYDIHRDQISAKFLALCVSTPTFLDAANRTSSGTTHRIRAEEENFLSIEIPLPPLEKQSWLIQLSGMVEEARVLHAEAQQELDALMPSILAKAFAGEL